LAFRNEWRTLSTTVDDPDPPDAPPAGVATASIPSEGTVHTMLFVALPLPQGVMSTISPLTSPVRMQASPGCSETGAIVTEFTEREYIGHIASGFFDGPRNRVPGFFG
jgi:hypothetical protein